MPPIEWVPISTLAYIETKKEAIRHQVYVEGKNIPELHEWFIRSYGLDPWVGEGQLGNKVKKWKKDEPGQWIRVVSLPPRRTSQMAFVPAREIQSAPTGASLMPTSTLGAGAGSMASPYVHGPLSGRAPVPSGTNKDYGSSYFGSRSGYNNTVDVNSGNATGPSISQNYNDGYGMTKQGTPPSAFMPVTLCEGCNRPEGEGNHFSCEIWNA